MNWREAAGLRVGSKVRPTKKNSIYREDIGIVMNVDRLRDYDHGYVNVHWLNANKVTRFSTLQLTLLAK